MKFVKFPGSTFFSEGLLISWVKSTLRVIFDGYTGEEALGANRSRN